MSLSLQDELSLLERESPQLPFKDVIRVLQRCRKDRDRNCAARLHSYVQRNALETHTALGPALVSLFIELGNIINAYRIFEKLPQRTETLCNSLISGFAKHGNPNQALSVYEKMQRDFLRPTSHTFVPLLNACSKLRSPCVGQSIHADICRHNLEKDLHVGSTLVDMYVKCDLILRAEEVFHRLEVRDAVSWNSLMAGYAKCGLGREVLNCFEIMRLHNVSPTAVTYVCSMKACGSIGDIVSGQEIQDEIALKGLEGDLYVGSAVVDMYASFGFIDKAREAFEKLPYRDVVSWTSLIGCYLKHACFEEVLSCFQQMQLESCSPNTYTFVYSLKACSNLGDINKAFEIHASIAAEHVEKDLFVSSSLIDMYANFGLFVRVQEVFNQLPVRDVVSWNALITAYAKHGNAKDALSCFEKMKMDGLSPNNVTFLSALRACSLLGATDIGSEIHNEISKSGWATDLMVGSALVDLYASCGELEKAQEVFDELSTRNVVSWNALITGYIRQGAAHEALECFQLMKCDDCAPDVVTYISGLKACGVLGTAEMGHEIYNHLLEKGLEKEVFVGSALIDMYTNCGILTKARDVFNDLPSRDVATWNAIIAGYAQIGFTDQTIDNFDRMVSEGHCPTTATFVSVLNACSHAGLVDVGFACYKIMQRDYNIIPSLEHHNCILDLLSRAGQLENAIAMTENMPIIPNLVVWHTLLSASRKWGSLELGRHSFQQALQLDERDPSSYFYMFNLLMDAGLQCDAEKVQVMRLLKVKKNMRLMHAL